MPDYGHELLFGVFLPPTADHADEVVDLAVRSDQLGLDLISVQDHPYQPAFLETWTLLSVIATRTSRATVFPNVANLPLRDPGVLARAVASLDILSGGRVELGLGTGAFWDAIEAMGGPRRSPGEAIDALGEAISVIRSLWTPGRGVRFDGRHYRLAGAKPGPFPVHPVGIWLGAYKPRMLRLVGQLADGWLPSSPYAPPDQLAAMNAHIDDAADAAGRPRSAIRRLYNIAGSFTGTGTDFLQGPPEVWVEQLAELALSEGISGFVLMVDPATPSDVERYAHEVAPAVRELVARERGTGNGPDAADGTPQARSTETGSNPTGSNPTRSNPTRSSQAGSTGALPGQARPADVGPTGAPSTDAPSTDAPSTDAPSAHARPGTPGPHDLGVTPTPDTGVRLSDEQPWDESTRPSGPRPDPRTVYSPAGRAHSQRLVDIHNELRSELEQIRDLVRQVMAGTTDPAAARSAINAMTLRQNTWTLGAYCQSYCRIVTLHHTVEDVALFPQLRRADPRLAPVVERLQAEHEVIADILNRVDDALVALVEKPGDMTGLRRAVDVLTDALLSHLAYEESQLVEPLARLSIDV